MKVFILIQTHDIEVAYLRVFQSQQLAEKIFNQIAKEDGLLDQETYQELAGTLRVAGDDANCLQLVARIAA